MVSPLSPIMTQAQPDNTLQNLLAGRQAYQQSQLAGQAIKQNDMDMQRAPVVQAQQDAMAQQQISRADYDQAVQRLSVINRLAKKARELPAEQRGGFVQSLNQDMLRSVGVDPAQIGTVQLDDQSLDALIAQTGAALPQDTSQNRVQSSQILENGTTIQLLANGSTRVTDPSGKELTGEARRNAIQEANQYGVDIQSQRAGGRTSATIGARVEGGGQAEFVEAVGTGRGRNAAEAEAAAGKSEKTANNLLANIKQAREILPKATGSGVGAMVDAAGRVVGISTEQSKAASQLETLAGWMVANVPRMEGPQSNFDVENYKTMAAKVGNSSIPVEERLAALDILEQLQMKYSENNMKSIGATPGIAPGTVTSKYKIEVMD